jgi:hypothetical protein
MTLKNKMTKTADRRPLALIIFGGVLTLLWLALLISFSLSLLQTL